MLKLTKEFLYEAHYMWVSWSKFGVIKVQWQTTGRQKRSELHHRGEFLHNYAFESVHDGDHDGVVRIFVGLSCELGGLIT